MQTKYILPFMALALITGCASWKVVGTNFDSYVQKKGAPESEHKMQNGNTLYFYRTICADNINWNEYNIEVDQQNIIVKKTDTKTCPITTSQERERKCEKGSGKCVLVLLDELTNN